MKTIFRRSVNAVWLAVGLSACVAPSQHDAVRENFRKNAVYQSGGDNSVWQCQDSECRQI